MSLLCLLGRCSTSAFRISSSKCLKAPDPKFAVCATLLCQMQRFWVSHVTSPCLAQQRGQTHGNEPCSTFPGESCICAAPPQNPTQILHPLFPGTATAHSEHGARAHPAQGGNLPQKNLQAPENGGQNPNISLRYDRMKTLPAPWCG